MQQRRGVIDLGTNTFHLLIAEQDEQGNLQVLHRERHYVKLAEGGIERISPTAFVRALNTLGRFSQRLKEWEVSQVQAIGTAALRKAANSEAFVTTAAQQTGINISVISGEKEAAYIWRGVAQAIPMQDTPHLIMDIGGGSVEFIIGDGQTVFWQKSYPIGVAVLRHRFHQQEPISQSEQTNLQEFLMETLAEVRQQCQDRQVTTLIGASGTFDVLFELFSDTTIAPHAINLEHFLPWQQTIVAKTLEERLQTTEIPTNRADMMVVALILIQSILDCCAIKNVLVSPFAMKEGILHSGMPA